MRIIKVLVLKDILFYPEMLFVYKVMEAWMLPWWISGLDSAFWEQEVWVPDTQFEEIKGLHMHMGRTNQNIETEANKIQGSLLKLFLVKY